MRENQRLATKWRHDFDAVSAEELVRFIRSRTMQLLYILACAMVVILVYNWQLSKAGDALENLNTQIETLEQAQQKAATQAPPPQRKATTPAAATATDSYYPPLTTQAAPANIAPAKPTVDDVYNPEKKSNGNEAVMDGIKKRYENILVIYMFLKQCNKAGANDYPIILSALAQEMASVNAPGRMQYDIITSAKGSYKEMYSRSSCDDASVAGLHTQYTDYIKALSNNVPAP